MPIKVFPSTMPGAPVEVHHEGGLTIGEWFDLQGLDYRAKDIQPVEVSVNGMVVPATKWDAVRFESDDDVAICLIPNGGVFKALGSILGKVFNLAFGWLTPRSKGASSGSSQQGSQIENSQATANTAKLGEVVPELAGRFRRYPDYLNEPRRFYENKREQRLMFLACIGPGYYQINSEDVKIGDTPFSSLGTNAEFKIFPPNADLSAQVEAQLWHAVDEVGGTSSGTAGLELPTEIGNRDNVDPASYTFSDGSITRSSGAWPSAWGNGTMVHVELSLAYDVVDHAVEPTESAPGYTISRFTGYFGHVGVPSPGYVVSVGPIGATVLWQVESVVSAAGGGVYTLQFKQNGSDPMVPIRVTPGAGQSRVFGALVDRNIVSFDDSAIVVAPGAFPAGTSAARVVYVAGTIYGEWSIEVAASPGNEKTTLIEADFFMPEGLCYIADDGDVEPRSVQVEIQYRDKAGGPRVSVSRFYYEATPDQIGFTEALVIPEMAPMVRVRRVGAEATSQQVRDKVQWYGLKSRLPNKNSYPWTTIGVSIRSGGKLGAQSENQINLIAQRLLPTLQPDGTWSDLTPTRDISAFVRHVAQSIGYTDADIDTDELQRLHGIWTARGETFDHVFDETTVKEALNMALGAGMAEFTVNDGRIRPVRDGIRTQFEQSYSPQNMTSALTRTFRSRRIDDADGVEVEYTDGETWTKETVRCLLPGDEAFKLEKIQLRGVTDRTRAWRIGMRRRRELRYRNWDYSFSTEMDALNSRYLSYVPLIDGDPGYGKSAILEGIEQCEGGALLHLSEPMEWEAGTDHVIAYRRPDGTLAGPYAAYPGPDEYSVVADVPLPWPTVTLKQEPPHAYFGALTTWCFPALITEVRPNGFEAAAVSAVNYDARVYASDDEIPPT